MPSTPWGGSASCRSSPSACLRIPRSSEPRSRPSRAGHPVGRWRRCWRAPCSRRHGALTPGGPCWRASSTQSVSLGLASGGFSGARADVLLRGRLLSLAGVAPSRVDGLDWMAGMASGNLKEYSLAVEGEAALTPFLEDGLRTYVEIKGPEVGAALGSLVSDVDKGALTGVFADFLAATFRHAVSNGIAGWRDADLAFVRDWGFDLAKIEPPVAVWQGPQGLMGALTHVPLVP